MYEDLEWLEDIMIKEIKNNNPKLTVVIPIYNVEVFLPECIKSVINQTYQNLEIILVDDGSLGCEGAICDKYATDDKRIKVIHKENAGLISARKSGIEAATSEYITFVDGDDYIEQDYYDEMMGLVIQYSPDLVCVNFTEDRAGQYKKIFQKMPSGIYEQQNWMHFLENMNCYQAKYYEYGIWPSTCMKIYKTSILRQTSKMIPENIHMGEDCAFTFPYILNSQKIVVDNSITGYYYRINNNSMSHEVSPNLTKSASDLYDYLKIFYYHTDNQNVKKQLEYLRTCYIGDILRKYERTITWKNISRQMAFIRECIQEKSLFSNTECLDDLDIPAELKEKINLIRKNKWSVLKIKWIKKLVWSCLYTMAKKVLKRQ